MSSDTLQFIQLGASQLEQVLFIQQGWQGAWTQKQLTDHISHNSQNYALVDNQHKVCAFVLFQCVLNEATLLLVMVEDEHRRKGLAKSLLKQAFECLQKLEVEKIYLELRKSNQAALSLYERLGFCLDGVRKNYYPAAQSGLAAEVNAREDALLMSVSL